MVRLAAQPGRQLLPSGGSARHAHAQCPLLRDPLRGHPGHRPERAPARWSMAWSSADALHHGRSEALSRRLRDPLPGVRGQFLLGVDGGLDEPHGAALPRLDQQRRMDRGAARHHPARGRDQAGWRVDAGRGGGCRGSQPQHPHRQGDGRRAARLCRQRRGLAPLPGLSPAPPAPRLRGEHEHQVAAPPQDRHGTLAHAVGHPLLRRSDARWDGARVHLRHGSQVGHHVPLWRAAPPGTRLRRDHGVGLVRTRTDRAGRRLHRRRPDLGGGDAAGAGAADGLDALPPALDVGRPAGPVAEPGHRRDRLCAADASPSWSKPAASTPSITTTPSRPGPSRPMGR